MGDNYLEAQANNTKKRRAKAVAKINEPRLLVRPDHIIDRYTLDCQADRQLAPGDSLICLPNAVSGTVDVVRGHEHIGQVMPDGGGESLAAEIESLGIGLIRVESIDLLGESAQVELLSEEPADGQ